MRRSASVVRRSASEVRRSARSDGTIAWAGQDDRLGANLSGIWIAIRPST